MNKCADLAHFFCNYYVKKSTFRFAFFDFSFCDIYTQHSIIEPLSHTGWRFFLLIWVLMRAVFVGEGSAFEVWLILYDAVSVAFLK